MFDDHEKQKLYPLNLYSVSTLVLVSCPFVYSRPSYRCPTPLASLTPVHVHSVGVLCRWTAGDAGQSSRQQVSNMAGSQVSQW